MNVNLNRSLRVGAGALVVIGALAFGMGATRISHASGDAQVSSDPMVAVVRDGTNPGCILRTIQHSELGEKGEVISDNSVPCPQGTIMGVVQVHRSEALVKHEDYVVMPSQSSSAATIQSFEAQLRSLTESANVRLHAQQTMGRDLQYQLGATSATARMVTDAYDTHNHPQLPTHADLPQASCNVTSYTADVINGSFYYDKKDVYDMWVDWDVHSDCSYYVSWSQIWGRESHTSIYWAVDKYAGWSNSSGPGCQYIGTNLLDYDPRMTHSAPPSYSYEQWVMDGSHCTIFDHNGYFDLWLHP